MLGRWSNIVILRQATIELPPPPPPPPYRISCPPPYLYLSRKGYLVICQMAPVRQATVGPAPPPPTLPLSSHSPTSIFSSVSKGMLGKMWNGFYCTAVRLVSCQNCRTVLVPALPPRPVCLGRDARSKATFVAVRQSRIEFIHPFVPLDLVGPVRSTRTLSLGDGGMFCWTSGRRFSLRCAPWTTPSISRFRSSRYGKSIDASARM